MEKRNRYQQINWYPGHMFKSFKIIENELKVMDIVFLLVDARIPKSSMNPKILKLLKNKPTLIILNKSDLADPTKLDSWVSYYKDLGFESIKLDSRNVNINQITNKTNQILKDKILKDKKKGLRKRNFKTIILGIPNVGKSTLINNLAKRRSTKVGDRPGVTKTKQWVKLKDTFDLLDVPGVLWPKFDDDEIALKLAVTGAIKDEILPLDEVTYYLIKFMQKNYLKNLQERYSNKIDENTEFIQCLDIIGKRRGALISGGNIDYERVYNIILNDFRNKQLGRVSLDNL